MIHAIYIAAYCVVGAIVAGILRRTGVLDDGDEDNGGHVVCAVLWPMMVVAAALYGMFVALRWAINKTLAPIYYKIGGDR